ncbi:MAG: MopE-related protein, partial [Myxococcota bacterium]
DVPPSDHRRDRRALPGAGRGRVPVVVVEGLRRGTVDTCAEGPGCVFTPTDRDGDGDGVTSCGGDCNDDDPRVRPGAPEVCDLIDQDCDGRFDEGTLSECNDCRSGCQIVDVPREVGGRWERSETDLNGVQVGPDGSISLSAERLDSRFGWIANTFDGSVTKLDLSTGAQAAEFHSTLQGDSNGARPLDERCFVDLGRGNCPSRTAVDGDSNVYVANRAFENQGTLTKIAGLEENCIDRNGNGRIDTSRDLNGDGQIDRESDEFLGQRDECLLWTVNVGRIDGLPRAVAIDASGFVWVGLHDGLAALKLSPADGSVVSTVLLRSENFRPYGAAISGDGTLWLTEVFSGRILAINTATDAIERVTASVSPDEGCEGNYGIAIDTEDRVWTAGFQCRHAARYDPRTNSWFHVNLPLAGLSRGIAVDDRGFIYMTSSHDSLTPGGGLGTPIARVTRFRDDGTDVEIFDLPGLASVGVGLDDRRNVWIINQDSGTAVRLNPETGETRSFPVGDEPYTYSDFTGFAFRTITTPTGTARTTVEGCDVGPTEWERLTWSATTPGGSTVRARYRSAPTREALAMAPWSESLDTNPRDLSSVPQQRFLQVEFVLTEGPGNRSPSLRNFQVQYNCPI